MKKQPLVPEFGKKVRLSDFDPGYTGKFKDKDEAAAEMEAMLARLDALQERLYAENQRALLIVFQGMDTSGKDGAIRHVFSSMDPQGVRVATFKQPSAEELAHDFLWRIHKQTPSKGMVTIFNRSHYEDVLVVRVHHLVPHEVWQERYDHINAFEELLTEHGVTILKFFLHISKDEQKERLEARRDTPEKQWKFALGDLEERKHWDEYVAAYEEALTRCNTERAPWHIVPANRKWYRNYAISHTVLKALERLNPQFPKPVDNLAGIVVPE
ncbi:MAG: polyphosphate kinase 2 family protein [Anaerolineae bacterium]|nr:polyphosphate kinase 2 family protein [Anaerolineae bacterium]